MKTIRVQMDVPEDMRPYVRGEDTEMAFERNAMMLYPFIRKAELSHGRAAEILGVRKWDLIEFYNSIGIPYLDQGKEELLSDLETLGRVLGEEK